MPKKYRLSRADFSRLARAKSRRIHGTYFSLMIAPLLSPGVKAACVVSKKTASRSVDRNAIERKCREALRPLLSSVEDSSAYIFYAKRGAMEASSGEIKTDVVSLLKRAGLRVTPR